MNFALWFVWKRIRKYISFSQNLLNPFVEVLVVVVTALVRPLSFFSFPRLLHLKRQRLTSSVDARLVSVAGPRILRDRLDRISDRFAEVVPEVVFPTLAPALVLFATGHWSAHLEPSVCHHIFFPWGRVQVHFGTGGPQRLGLDSLAPEHLVVSFPLFFFGLSHLSDLSQSFEGVISFFRRLAFAGWVRSIGLLGWSLEHRRMRQGMFFRSAECRGLQIGTIFNVVWADCNSEHAALRVQESEGTVLLEGVELQLALLAVEADCPAEGWRLAWMLDAQLPEYCGCLRRTRHPEWTNKHFGGWAGSSAAHWGLLRGTPEWGIMYAAGCEGQLQLGGQLRLDGLVLVQQLAEEQGRNTAEVWLCEEYIRCRQRGWGRSCGGLRGRGSRRSRAGAADCYWYGCMRDRLLCELLHGFDEAFLIIVRW